MKTIFEHIEHVKGKPHHIRKRIAFASAAVGAAVIALVWLVGSFSLGLFAIQGSSFADSTGQSPVVTTNSNEENSGLAGAAAALPQSANTPAHIEIIDASPTTSGQKKAEQTTIPF
jgi:hypothetical protein